MNWEQTIKFIRAKPEYEDLVAKAYFDENLVLNVERFRSSEEYEETKIFLKRYTPNAKTILDIGSGNGISAIAFALDGYNVTVTEPDPSDTVGAGAVRKLKGIYNLENLAVFEEFAENLQLDGAKFDVVYLRQAMHHAFDLNLFVSNITKLLKKGGLLITARDHVIYDEQDKQWFLENHPLQKFYGGENAFTEQQYVSAIQAAGCRVVKRLKYYDSVINYFPHSSAGYKLKLQEKNEQIKNHLIARIGPFAKVPFIFLLYKLKLKLKGPLFPDEKLVPGRMYTFLAIKK